MAQPISNLTTGTLVNLIENRSGTKYLTPFLIIAKDNGNPYGSDKVLCVRYNTLTDNIYFDNNDIGVYNGSTIDTQLTNTYLARFDQETINCIAQSTVKNFDYVNNQLYLIARRVFCLSNKELGGNYSDDPSDSVSYFTSNNSRKADYDDGRLNASYWTRTLTAVNHACIVSNDALYLSWNLRGNGVSLRPALNLYASCKVSSEPNSDGSYNLLPSVYAGIGDGSTGVSGAAVDPSVFLQQISDIGSYTFTYTGSGWEYDGDGVDIADYGITVTGTPAANDTVIVTIPQVNQILDFSCALGETSYMPTQCVVDWAEVNNGTTTLQLCNNYNDDSPTWENAQKNVIHNFTNTTKTATDWCVGAKFYAESENTIKIYAPHALIRKW